MPHADFTALAGNWKALIICPNRAVSSELTPLIAEQLPRMPVFEMQSYPARQVLAELSGPRAPNLCFLDLAADCERGLNLISELLAVEPSMRIIVLLASKDPDVIMGAMRQGAVEFLVRPFTSEQLQHAAERLVSLGANGASNATHNGRVYAVIPSKGACGASTLAANLAPQWKRFGFERILLADLDPLTGTQSFLLKLKSNYSFLDALSRSTSLDADIWKGIVSQAAGVDVLLSPENVQEGMHELRDCSSIIEFSKVFYQAVVLDAASVYGNWNLNIVRMCDELLLVTTNELPALQATQRALSYLDEHHVNRSKIHLVVNRYNREHGLSREVIETALHCEVYHLVPSDYEAVQRALIEGKPIPASSSFGKSVTQLAERLAGREEVAPKKTSAFASLKALFSR